ncbi:MAG: hypothetical protein HYT71_02405 [Candidatus Aenigmarchaeota archaeon]|nr:hypothetical protein [Candidatus Aenigmarchaeota archaeon]
MRLFHFTLVYADGKGRETNRFGEPFTVDKDGLRRSQSHPVCLTPSLDHATTYATDNKGRNAKAIVYTVESDDVPDIRSGNVVWTAEYVPRDAIKDMIQVRVTRETTPRDIQYHIEKSGKFRGWM